MKIKNLGPKFRRPWYRWPWQTKNHSYHIYDNTSLTNCVTSLAVGGNNVYAGLFKSPGTVAKLPRAFPDVFGTVDYNSQVKIYSLGASDEIQVSSIAVDNDHLYAGLYTSPGIVATVKLSDPDTQHSLHLHYWDKMVTALAINDTFLYIALYESAASQLYQVSKDVLSIGDIDPYNKNLLGQYLFDPVHSVALPSGEGGYNALAIDSNYLYAGRGDGKVVRITPIEFAIYDFLQLAVDVSALAIDSNHHYLYAGLDRGPDNPGSVVQIGGISGSTMSVVSILPLAESGSITSLAVDSGNNCLYVGLAMGPGKGGKVATVNLTVQGLQESSSVLYFDQCQVTSLALLGGYLYAGLCSTNQGSVAMIDLALPQQLAFLSSWQSN